MKKNNNRRLIEDYLPIQAISKEASREKSVRKGHISTLHLWWARRPLVACRAAVYGALVPASKFVPDNGPDNKKQSLGRANAAKFIEALCKYPGNPEYIRQAQQHILEAHAERLTEETGKKVTAQDIIDGRAPRPKVLDMFAGGGAIPLEALRLGCEAYALDLNPVAYIIELCTLVYPQKYGKADMNARGMTGPKNAKGEITWGGLAHEVRYWGNWVLERVREEIGDLYPPIPDPKAPKTKQVLGKAQLEIGAKGFESKGQQKLTIETPEGFLTPVAYLWTRTVRCKNPACGAIVPLVRQTWLCKSKDRYVAMRMIAPKKSKIVRFEVVESKTEKGLGLNPDAFSKGGNATCPFCGSVADGEYVKTEANAKRMGEQMMAIICISKEKKGKLYFPEDTFPEAIPDDALIQNRIMELTTNTGIDLPNELIEANPRSMDTQHYGFEKWKDIFSPRQQLCLLTFASTVAKCRDTILSNEVSNPHAEAIQAYLASILDRLADFNSTICVHNYFGSSRIAHTFGRQALPMVWDFAESNPFHSGSGGWGVSAIYEALSGTDALMPLYAQVMRGTATELPWQDNSFDSVITDPPYYDNVSYSNLSDFFYVWLKRTVGFLFTEHFANEATPKKNEIIAAYYRHDEGKKAAKEFYENMMNKAFQEANRVLKPNGHLVVVYAHKTTLGWSSLVDSLRRSSFAISEAWPLDTEKVGRLIAQDVAALASSIFLIARKRQGNEIGSYEQNVRKELEEIVKERVESLWKMGISGADLLIAAVGAGLRAYTRFARVEYANGEEVPAEKFLAEVEGVVLEMLLEKIFKVTRSGLSSVDGPSRFYVLWRHTYRTTVLDAGEAIVFSYGQPVELDGAKGLSAGSYALVEKKKGKYTLCDFTERGKHKDLGMPSEEGEPAPLIDVLHRALWLIENEPRKLNGYLDEARPDTERLRLVANAIYGASLERNGAPQLDDSGRINTTPKEHAALAKLLANWNALMEGKPLFRMVKKTDDLFDK